MKVIYRNGISFKKWMENVDSILSKKIGLVSADLPDFCWGHAYEEEMTSRNAVEECISFLDAELSSSRRYACTENDDQF